MYLLEYDPLHIYTLKRNKKIHKLLWFFSENIYKFDFNEINKW